MAKNLFSKDKESLALYIHWPFCLSKCPYCDFNSHIYGSMDEDVWHRAYMTSIEYFASKIAGKNITSIFFGGGTPSLMPPQLVVSIIDKIISIGCASPSIEITLEANPTSSCAAKFSAFRDAGVNRISIGVQSLRNDGLIALGREHNTNEARQAVELAQKTFARSSFDLIYARPNQTLDDWQAELEEVVNLSTSHLSLYQLTIEKGTPFYKMHKDKSLILPDNDLAADMYHLTNEYLNSHGYNAYEISNYARSQEECRHNLVYWNYGDYLGIGPGAHSRMYDKSTKSVAAIMNWSLPAKWLGDVNMSSAGIQQTNVLSREEVVEEILMMGLRLKSGISDARLKKATGFTFKDILNDNALQQYIDTGFVIRDGQNLCLTDKGLLMHSYLVPRLLL